MPTYKVISDLNGGKHPVGSEIELTEEQAAAIPWAVKPVVQEATEDDVETKGEVEVPAEAFVEAPVVDHKSANKNKARSKK